jgi:hypothetical protein
MKRILCWCAVIGLTLVGGLSIVSGRSPASQPTTVPVSIKELRHVRTVALQFRPYSLGLGRKWRRFDPSGLVYLPKQKRFYTVNDKARRFRLFSFSLPALGQQTTPIQMVYNHKVFWPEKPHAHWPRFKMRLDMEGVTVCGGAVYVVSEQQRLVIRYHLKTKKVTRHPIDFATYERKTAQKWRPVPRFSVSFNAGYEGITCDPRRKRLYLIQERQPRMIFAASWLSTWKDGTALSLIDHFDLPSLFLPKRVKGVDLPPDFAGAAMSGSFLYVLYRNARVVMKVDPIRHALIQTVSYGKTESKLYASPKPYGLAEGLALSSQRLFLVFDNNGRPRAQLPTDRRPVVASFKRPKGF